MVGTNPWRAEVSGTYFALRGAPAGGRRPISQRESSIHRRLEISQEVNSWRWWPKADEWRGPVKPSVAELMDDLSFSFGSAKGGRNVAVRSGAWRGWRRAALLQPT